MIPYGYKQTEVGVIPEDWSVSALEKLYNITSSKRVFQSQWRKSGVPFYRAREIAVMSEGKIAPEDLYIDESLYNQYIHQYGSINKNDILITGVGTLGKVYVVKENDRFYFKDGNIIWLQSKHDFSSIYLKYQYDMPALINQVFGNAGGSTVATYTITNAKTTKVPVPPLQEQHRIAEALSDVDGMISSLEKLVAKYKSIKTACLQQMFPQNGETVPRMRLPGFTGAWEQRKVSDLAEKTYGGGTPTTSNEAYWNGDIPWIQSSDVVDGKLLGVEPRKWITQDGLNNSAAQLIPGNSIAIITRVGVGKLAFMPYSYATSQDFLSLSKLNAEPLFTVYACYKKLQSELNAVQGTSIKGITKDELLAKNIMVPRYAEQQQIGAYFKQLDNLITLHQRKLEKIQKIKQGMMQQLLTGKIRLV